MASEDRVRSHAVQAFWTAIQFLAAELAIYLTERRVTTADVIFGALLAVIGTGLWLLLTHPGLWREGGIMSRFSRRRERIKRLGEQGKPTESNVPAVQPNPLTRLRDHTIGILFQPGAGQINNNKFFVDEITGYDEAVRIEEVKPGGSLSGNLLDIKKIQGPPRESRKAPSDPIPT